MRSVKPLVVAGFSVLGAAAESDPACSSPGSPSVTTMYITVPASPVTETVYASSPVTPFIEGGADSTIVSTVTSTNSVTETIYVASPGFPSVEVGAKTVIIPTLTDTHSVASTHVIQVFQASSSQGPYSFEEDNGTTSWMGGQTPPASAFLVTSTSFVTLQPVSTAVAEGASAAKTTSYVTISSTRTVTRTSTETLTESVSVVPASAEAYTGHAYTGYGSAGWNSTLMTSFKLKVNPTGSVRANPSVYEPSASLKVWSQQGGPYASPTSFSKLMRPIKPRQVGDIIVATIDEVAVSWTNSYDGSTPTVSEAAPTFVPVTATAPPFRGAASSTYSPSPSPIQISSSPTATSATTVGSSPWDLGSNSSVLATAASTVRQPGIVPMPSISTSGMASVLSAIFTAQPASSTMHTRVSSTRYSNTLTGSYSAASTANSSCSDVLAHFTINFDDLPSFSTGPSDTDIPPIFNPYRKLYWEGHYGYVPPPTDPFPPHSPPQLAVYREDGLNFTSSTDAGLELTGGLGSGPRADYNAYWFDALSAWLGCANVGPEDCKITITGYAIGKGNVTTVIGQTVTQPPCPGLKNCSLAFVSFDEGFRSLTTLQIVATNNEGAVDWYMDDLELSWSNNSCAAQLMRSSSE